MEVICTSNSAYAVVCLVVVTEDVFARFAMGVIDNKKSLSVLEKFSPVNFCRYVTCKHSCRYTPSPSVVALH